MYHYLIQSNTRRVAHGALSMLVVVSLLSAPLLPALVYAEEMLAVMSEPSPLLPEVPAEIVTGDATAGLETLNIVNLNDTETGADTASQVDSEETEKSEEASSQITDSPTEEILELSQEIAPEDTEDVGGNTSPVIASTTNEATITNSTVITAETGDNTALGDNSLILTGDAIAYANIVNIANTNIFNSDGLIGFFNEVLGVDPFDLRDAFSIFDTIDTSVSTLPCSLSVCGSGASTFTLNATNTATITNDVTVNAQSGGNTGGSGSLIGTGDAFAAANIFNVANTNIVDSNYLLIAFNNFGDYAADIVLPGADALSSLFNAGGVPVGSADSDNTNTATIGNNLVTNAETGGNTASSGIIATGEAYADSSIQNIVNTNLFGGSDFLLVLRIHGDWNGDVFGLPLGMAWQETENGIVLYNTSGAQGSGAIGNISSTNANIANIQNNVSVYALTGDNKVGDDGAVSTGDAYASANVTNVTNTNILGQNWALLIFDIFGNWSGNLAFGKPDLWIGGKATPHASPIMPGTEVTYTYTVVNNGDATATNVKLDNHFNEGELVSVQGVTQVEHDSRGAHGVWSLGDIAPHATKEVSFTTMIHRGLPTSMREIVTEATVTALEPDADTSDNTEYLSIYSGKNRGSSHRSKSTQPAEVVISKSANVATVEPGGSVDYTITVTNNGGPILKSMLRDVLKNENGATTSEQYWDLGTIKSKETLSVTYTMQFAEDATYGTYTNTADIFGLHQSKTEKTGKYYESPKATHTLTIGDITPEVLGAEATMCEPYLKTYMRYGIQNDPAEVLKLQQFLKRHMGSNVPINGTFDLLTEIGVRDFQKRYADEVLYPWGLKRDSGFVYYTTQKKINEIECDYRVVFPLNATQGDEILRFRNFMNGYNDSSTDPVPLFGETQQSEPNVSIGSTLEPVVLNERIPLIALGSTQTTTQEKNAPSIVGRMLGSLQKMLHWLGDVASR